MVTRTRMIVHSMEAETHDNSVVVTCY